MKLLRHSADEVVLGDPSQNKSFSFEELFGIEPQALSHRNRFEAVRRFLVARARVNACKLNSWRCGVQGPDVKIGDADSDSDKRMRAAQQDAELVW